MTADPRQLPADDLRAETRRLRKLARALVADEHGAEDVVQDAWATALEQRRSRGPLGWLRGVVRNHARQQRRTDRRRQAREQLAARSEATGDPVADHVARLDLLRHLLDQVRE